MIISKSFIGKSSFSVQNFRAGCVTLRKSKIGFLIEIIRKWILRFFPKQINPRSVGSWCVKGIEESTLDKDSSVPLTHRDPKDPGLICLVKKREIRFRIPSDFRIQSRIFVKNRTLSHSHGRNIYFNCKIK